MEELVFFFFLSLKKKALLFTFFIGEDL